MAFNAKVLQATGPVPATQASLSTKFGTPSCLFTVFKERTDFSVHCALLLLYRR